MNESQQRVEGFVEERYVHFSDRASDGDVLLMHFKDPSPTSAFLTREAPAQDSGSDVLVVRVLPLDTKQEHAAWLKGKDQNATPAIHVKSRDGELLWCPGRVVLQCNADAKDLLLQAVVEFAHYEGQLRRMEKEISDSWSGLEEDRGLAFDVTPADLRRATAVGKRMEQTFRRRIEFARMGTNLYTPSPMLTSAGRKLGEELREKARVEERAEALNDQIEVFEHIYEMSSQRIGEYKASRQGAIIEWIIIALLAMETLLMLAQVVWKPHS